MATISKLISYLAQHLDVPRTWIEFAIALALADILFAIVFGTFIYQDLR